MPAGNRPRKSHPAAEVVGEYPSASPGARHCQAAGKGTVRSRGTGKCSPQHHPRHGRLILGIPRRAGSASVPRHPSQGVRGGGSCPGMCPGTCPGTCPHSPHRRQPGQEIPAIPLPQSRSCEVWVEALGSPRAAPLPELGLDLQAGKTRRGSSLPDGRCPKIPPRSGRGWKELGRRKEWERRRRKD